MTKSKFATFCATVVAGAVAWCLWLQYKHIARLEAENQALREQLSQTEVLRREEQRLIEGKPEAEPPRTEQQELLRLRGQLTLLQRAAREDERLQAEVDKLGQKVKEAEAQRIDAFFGKHPEQRLEGSRMLLARVWGYALRKFSRENDGRLPDSIAAAAQYLADEPKEQEFLEMVAQATTNAISIADLELVYHGSLKGVEDRSKIILIRERQPVHTADGRWSRVYVYGDGDVSNRYSDTPDFTDVDGGVSR